MTTPSSPQIITTPARGAISQVTWNGGIIKRGLRHVYKKGAAEHDLSRHWTIVSGKGVLLGEEGGGTYSGSLALGVAAANASAVI